MVRPKKHLGQHFLKNQAIAAQIADALSGENYDQILEIGPGMGVLTQFLIQRPEKIWAVEIDRESVDYLETHLQIPGKQIIQGDFLQLPLNEVFTGSLAIAGNFPYNISSQIIFKMLEYRKQIPELVGMFQKEVAERIVAEPGSKTYGILSVLTAAFYHREYLFTVEPHEFNPPPKVRSGVIRLKAKTNYALPCDEQKLKQVVKAAFNQRRKTLRNALSSFKMGEKMPGSELLTKRAEQIGLDDFINITNTLSS